MHGLGLGGRLGAVLMLLPALCAAGDPLRGNEADFLPVDQAFVFTTRLQEGRLVAHWDMPKGYYLYRNQMEVECEDASGAPELPLGRPIEDPVFGATDVYYDSVEIAVPLRQRPALLKARFRYQGCAASGFCYPAQERTVVYRRSEPAAREDDPRPGPSNADRPSEAKAAGGESG